MTALIAVLVGCAEWVPTVDVPPRPEDTTSLEVTLVDDALETLDATSVIVIDSDPTANGASYGIEASSDWWASETTPGFWGEDYLVAATEPVSDPAVFWFEAATSRCYDVQAWWTAGANRPASVVFIAQDPTGVEIDRAGVNQQKGGSQWNPLGRWTFPAGRNRVLLSRWAASDRYAIADAIRLIPCEAAEPNVALLSPSNGAVVENPVTFTAAGEGITRLVLYADEWEIGDWVPEEVGWSTTVSFSNTETPRLITLIGYDVHGTVIATDTATITVEASPAGVVLDVPYFYQYDNGYEPTATCGVTSTAMAIDYWYPSAVTPDSLYLEYGKAQAQSPSGVASIARSEGLYAYATTTGTRDEVRAHIEAGRPVVAHGFWTSAGHIVAIVGYDDEDWIVNDPAGDWYTCYGCGQADHVRYPIGGSWDDGLSWDGDIWYSVTDTGVF